MAPQQRASPPYALTSRKVYNVDATKVICEGDGPFGAHRDIVMPFSPVDAAEHPRTHVPPLSGQPVTETRRALMTRLCGLPSDEPFAIPPTRTVPVFAGQ